MNLYAIIRRGAWCSENTLGETAENSRKVGEEMPEEVRWIRSYVLEEEDGKLGTICIYQATSKEALLKHAKFADLPADAIILVDTTLIIRPDPE